MMKRTKHLNKTAFKCLELQLMTLCLLKMRQTFAKLITAVRIDLIS